MAHCYRKINISAAIGAILFPLTAYAQQLSHDDCKGITGIMLSVGKAAGSENLSTEFKQSLRSWLGPQITCDGPKQILIMNTSDSAAFSTMRQLLISGNRPISLLNESAAVKVGLEPVYSEALKKRPPNRP